MRAGEWFNARSQRELFAEITASLLSLQQRRVCQKRPAPRAKIFWFTLLESNMRISAASQSMAQQTSGCASLEARVTPPGDAARQRHHEIYYKTRVRVWQTRLRYWARALNAERRCAIFPWIDSLCCPSVACCELHKSAAQRKYSPHENKSIAKSQITAFVKPNCFQVRWPVYYIFDQIYENHCCNNQPHHWLSLALLLF